MFLKQTLILKLYHMLMKQGIDFIKKLNGMFSIGIYDKGLKNFFLIRDRVGIKPLYFFILKNSLFFSSEINSLISNPVFEKKS